MKRTVPTLAASALLGVLGTVALSAPPAYAFGLTVGDRAWTRDTRHWDHYFHTPSQYDAQGSIDRYRYERRRFYGPYSANPAWDGPVRVLLPY